jgi:hypothetical protein
VIYAVGGGTANTGSPQQDTAILWTSTGGLTALPNIVANTTATNFVTASAITPDAAYIAGRARSNTGNGRQAVVVTRSGLTNTVIPYPAGTNTGQQLVANGISSDGTIAYGFGSDSSTGEFRAFRSINSTTSPSATLIAFAGGSSIGNIGIGRGVSANGLVMVGHEYDATAFADNNRGTGNHAFRYVDGVGSTLIPKLSGGTWSTAMALSSDGNLTLVMGDSTAAANGGLYLYNASLTSLTDLGTPNLSWTPQILGGITSDGAVAVAQFYDYSSPTTFASYLHNANGWFNLEATLSGSGLDLSGWTGLAVLGVSADGTLLFGSGTHSGNMEGFVIEVPSGYLAAIPEPSTYAMLAGLAALGLAAWRRRVAV